MEIQQHLDGIERLVVDAPEFGAQFEIYGLAPVQAFGTVFGRDLYFRAKHDEWTFDVADSHGNLPSDGFADTDGFFRRGKHLAASYMPQRLALLIIAMCLREFSGAQA